LSKISLPIIQAADFMKQAAVEMSQKPSKCRNNIRFEVTFSIQPRLDFGSGRIIDPLGLL
jgi:hypothetical protein